MVQQKDKNGEANSSHQSQSTIISGELHYEQESVVKRRGLCLRENSKCSEADTWLNHLSSSSESVERRSVEPGISSPKSDVSAQIADINVVRNTTKISLLVGSHSPLHSHEGNKEHNSQKWSDAMISPENGVSDKSNQINYVSATPFCSNDSNSFNLNNKVEQDSKSSTDPANVPSFHSGKRVINSDIASDQFSMENRGTYVSEFDLNEDLNTTAMDDYVRQDETTSSHRVIRVVAKAENEIRKGLHVFPLKFEGQRGWTGPSETSAFHVVVPENEGEKTCPGINFPKNQKQLFDLNVAPVEDDVHNGLEPEPKCMSEPSTVQCSHVDDTRQTKRLKIDIDLNCSHYHTEDDPIRSSLRPKTGDSLLVDSNANALTVDECNNIPWLAHVHQCNVDQPEFNYASNNNWAVLRTMHQRAANSSQGQQHRVAAAPYALLMVDSMQRASPLHQTLPIAQYTLPPQNCLSTVPFHFGSSDVRTSGTIPHVRYSQEQGISPQLLYSGTVQHSFSAPRLFNGVHDHSKGNNNTPAPLKTEVKSDHDENLAANVSKKIEAGQSLSLLGQNCSMVDQEAWYL